MRYAILSDIHSNLEAFQEVMGACRDERVDIYLCGGDIVGYGANPNECIEMVRDLRAPTVAGNHDWAVSGKISSGNFNSVAQAAVYWTQKNIAAESIGYLSGLNLVFKNDDLILVHGTLDHPEEFNYLMDINQSPDTFYLMDRVVCFLGHTHVPQILVKRDGKISYSEDLNITLGQHDQYIVNVGSVGQPRDDDPRACFCIYDTQAKRVEIKRIPYDIKTTQRKILQAGLPDYLAMRLAVGR